MQSIRNQIQTLFIATPSPRRPGWCSVRMVKSYGRNFGSPQFEGSENRARMYKGTPEECEEKALKAHQKYF